MNNTGVPISNGCPTIEDIMGRTYDKYISDSMMVEYVKKEFTERGTKAFISSLTGTGKTFLICLFAIHCIDKGIPVNITLPTTDCVHQVVGFINKFSKLRNFFMV